MTISLRAGARTAGCRAAAVTAACIAALGAGAGETRAQTTSLPTWQSAYDWGAGHGYAGWHQQGLGAPSGPYGSTASLESRPGLWLWPMGEAWYRPGGSEWTITAPGTTRIASASLRFAYRERLFSHHCVNAGLRTSEGVTSGLSQCKPPNDVASRDAWPVAFADPDPTPASKQAFVDISMPDCTSGKAAGCERWIPSQDPLGHGSMLRVDGVDLVLVDDDLPVVTPSEAFYELAGKYIAGTETYPLRIDVTDAGAGIASVAVLHEGHPNLAERTSPCDPTHNTPALDSRICPEQDALDTEVDTRPMPEGTRRFRALGEDPAHNVGESAWSVIIDRSSPTPPQAPAVQLPREGAAQPTWDAATDPVLADGTPGSGVAGYRVRRRVGEQGWGEWETFPVEARTAPEVAGLPAGTEVTYELLAFDAVGNESEVVSVSARVTGGPPDVSLDFVAERDGDYIGDDTAPLTIEVDDDGAGVRDVKVTRGGEQVHAAEAACSAPDVCPPHLSTTYTVDGRSLYEGEHVFFIDARDAVGNATQEPFEISVDHTAPQTPVDIELQGWEAGDTSVTLSWDDREDPDLADGTPGSGIARTEYRVLRNGAWTEWLAQEDDAATLYGTYEREVIDAELRAVDGADNASPVVARRLTVGSSEVAAVAPQAMAVSRAAFFGKHCKLRTPPSFKKVGSRLRASFAAGCLATLKFSHVEVRLFEVDVWRNCDSCDKDEELDNDIVKGPRAGYYRVTASAACRQGRKRYKATYELMAPGYMRYDAEHYFVTKRRTFSCTKSEDEERHECLKPTARYRAATRSNFRWNLCIATNKWYDHATANAHHMLPIAFQAQFERTPHPAIPNIHDPIYAVWWRQPNHGMHALAYNRQWSRFFETKPRTHAQVLDKACDLARTYDLDFRYPCGLD